MGAEQEVFREADETDLPGVLAVQREAFGRVAHQLSIEPSDLPPLNETLAHMAAQLSAGTRFFVASDARGEIVGSVRGTDLGGTVEVGRLVVASAWVRRGVATRLMALLESAYPAASSFLLFTGEDAIEPLALYRKLGYSVVRRDGTGPVALVWLEKRNPRATT